MQRLSVLLNCRQLVERQQKIKCENYNNLLSSMSSKNNKVDWQISQTDLLLVVQDYLNSTLLQHLNIFEVSTNYHAKYLDINYQKVPLAQNSQINYNDKLVELLIIGSNPGFWIKIKLIRVLQYSQLLICLAIDELCLHSNNRFVILALSFADRKTAKMWAQQNAYLSTIFVKNPFKITNSVYKNIVFVLTRPENIVVKKRYKLNTRSAESLKEQANTQYRQKNYEQALLTYEVGLGLISDPEKRRDRAVLYANSSQCLFEMRLYESALVYAEISTTLDRKYVKALYRKFSCYLELKQKNGLPQIMSLIQHRVSTREFQEVTVKYSKYQNNSLGIYDWSELLQQANCSFGEYYSTKLQKVKHEKYSSKEYSYRANNTINQFELIMIQKPLVYQKSKHEQFVDDYKDMMNQIKCHSQYETLFNTKCRQLPSHCIVKGQMFQESTPYGIYMNEVHSKCLRCLQLQKTPINTKIGEEFMGIWDNLYLYNHDCLSNCTYFQMKGGLIIFALKKIEKGESLTVDYLSWETHNRSTSMRQKLGRICDCAFCLWDWDYDRQASGQFLYEMYKQEKERLQETGVDKISLYFLWELIFFKSYNEKQLMKEYLTILERYPQWECIINCLRYMRTRTKNESSDQIKSTLKRIIERFFKMTHAQAVAFLKQLL